MINYDELNAIFIAAPREMSIKRFTQIVKHYLPKANIVLGIAKEKYVLGFENQSQFKMLKLPDVQSVIDKVAASKTPNKIYVMEYAQKEFDSILQKHAFKRVLLVNGSWKYAFHNTPAYQTLVAQDVPYKHISPFVNEAEAKEFAKTHTFDHIPSELGTILSEKQMLNEADKVAKLSYDYSFQTGAALGRKQGDGHLFLGAASNEVIPYDNYAMHFGNQREKNFSKPHDTNHYDTVHAEMNLILSAPGHDIKLKGTTMFINLLPCPNCARSLCVTDIEEIVYRHDHSDGYAVKMLELCGKKVRKLVE